ncbi:putative disease resistance protein RGA3 [Macadamia integrifolia]|uniref:putative disease resistance protein RGA3 n=1 Tax=Macadamia integrifolia TaxID=60698 RepID=UPI001C4F16C3|nr:putative disease resistance protein RGA3 [Macadamia integrifolia]
MAKRDYAAGDKKLMISTTLGRRGVQEYEELQRIVRETKVKLLDLERKELEDGGVWMLLKKIKELYYEADDVLDELLYEAMRIRKYFMMTRKVCNIKSLPALHLFHPLLLIFHHRMSGKIKVLNGKLLDEKKGKMEMKIPQEIYEIGPLPITIEIDLVEKIKVREDDKGKIIKMLMDQNEEMLSVIPIVGWEGVGKANLVKQIFNDESISSQFDLKSWISVSSEKGFDVKNVVKEIIEKTPGRRSMGDLKNLDYLQHMLEEILSGKRFLLVLDDVYTSGFDEEKWNNFRALLRVGSKGSKIIVTTPFEEVASIMATVPLIRGTVPLMMETCSSDEERWELFCREAFGIGGAEKSEDLVRIGLELVKECQGYQFELSILGGMMHFKKNKEEWETVLNTMKACRNKDIEISTLKICYNDMESPLKRCFAYCSVFPKNFIIERKTLIQLWMAEGFLEDEEALSPINGGDVKLMEDIGDDYFNSLVQRSFLQVVQKDDNGEPLECRMDDILHDFAQNKLWRYEATVVDDVRTFLRCPNNISSYGPLLLKFKSLRVLELRHINKDDLPSSIGELLHLRYLDLSHGSFKALPATISNLHHLQTLKLLHCKYLQRLPKGITKLINLRHLEIERSLDTPRGLGKLSNLQTFTSFKVGNDVTTEAADIEELRCLEQLGGRLSLIGLNNVKDGEVGKAANFKEKRRLKELTLEWESDWHVCTEEDSMKQDSVLEELQPHQDLFVLRILRFSGTKLPKWLNNGSTHLSKLRELRIYSCHHVKALDLTGLRSLRILMISYCKNLESAGVEGLMDLELLEFKACDKLSSLVGLKEANQREDQMGSSRANHAKLRIESCDNLTTLPEKLLQSLKTLHIESCTNRMVLMNGLENLSLLQRMQIENCPNLKELSEGVRQLSSLQHFEIRECPKLMFLSEEMQRWTSLQALTIFSCTNLRDLPRGIAKFSSLKELEISGCDCLISLPDEIQELMSLEILKIEQCSDLRALPAGLIKLSSLHGLEISSCNRLTSFPRGMQHLRSLDTLKIKGCDNLEKLPEEMGDPSTLRVLAIIGCPNLQVLPEGLGNLKNLHLLEIIDCSNLTALPNGLGHLSLLRSLYIQRCLNLESFPNTLPHMTSLQVLWLIDCPKLKDLSSGLRSLSTLEKLTIWGCHSLIKLFQEGIQELKSLQEVTISHCSRLKTLPDGLEKLPSLTELVIWKCPKLEPLENMIEHLKGRKLRKLNIIDCRGLETIDDAPQSPANIVLTPPDFRFVFSYLLLISFF